jgi:hypothetical protein
MSTSQSMNFAALSKTSERANDRLNNRSNGGLFGERTASRKVIIVGHSRDDGYSLLTSGLEHRDCQIIHCAQFSELSASLYLSAVFPVPVCLPASAPCWVMHPVLA